MWVEFQADSTAECQSVMETVLYTFRDLVSHLLIYLFMVYFIALL